MKTNFIALLVGFLLIVSSPLMAQVEQITIRWTKLLCKDPCIKILDRELKKIKGVDLVTIDPDAGQAIITWKANAPFQYTYINTAMHMVGLSIRDIRIRIHGPVNFSSNRAYIVSEGDNTRFELVNPVIPNLRGQAHEFNYSTRGLSPQLRQQIADGIQAKQIATVEGPVFMPERMTVPTQIVVDHLSFSSPVQPTKK